MCGIVNERLIKDTLRAAVLIERALISPPFSSGSCPKSVTHVPRPYRKVLNARAESEVKKDG